MRAIKNNGCCLTPSHWEELHSLPKITHLPAVPGRSQLITGALSLAEKPYCTKITLLAEWLPNPIVKQCYMMFRGLASCHAVYNAHTL